MFGKRVNGVACASCTSVNCPMHKPEPLPVAPQTRMRQFQVIIVCVLHNITGMIMDSDIWKNDRDMKGYPGISRDNPTWCLSRDNRGS